MEERTDVVGNIFGFSSKLEIRDDCVIKTYNTGSRSLKKRICKAYRFLRDSGLGPDCKIGKTLDGWSVCMERVECIYDALNIIRPKKMYTLMTNVVHQLHTNGWVHGDLHLGNWGWRWTHDFTRGRPVILDPDTMYEVQRDHPDWVYQWMWEGYEFAEDMFYEYVSHDYNNWREELDEYYDDSING